MSRTRHRDFARIRFALLALCVSALFLAMPSSSTASTSGGPQCMIEPWECEPKGGPETPCMIEPWECGEEAPEICINGLGRYIVVFQDWVEDPETLARAQVEQYGGELGFIYKYALKGYSAGYTEQAVVALRNEPSIKYISVDRIVTIADGSSEGSECEPSEPEPAYLEPGDTNKGTLDPPAVGSAETSSAEGGVSQASTSTSVRPCGKGKVRRADRCVRRRALARRACSKRAGVAKLRCMHRAMR